MPDEILKDFKKLWLMCHAQPAFASVYEASNYIIENNLKYGDQLFYPLFTSIVINYVRPFKKSNIVGKLVDDLVPLESQNLHGQLIAMRDTLIAHTDGNAPRDKWGSATEVRYRRTKSHFCSTTAQFHLSPVQIKEVKILSKILGDKVSYHIEKIQRKYTDKFPRKMGEYILNVDPKIKEHFIPVDPIPEEETKEKWI
jgi:hypothetical protein